MSTSVVRAVPVSIVINVEVTGTTSVTSRTFVAVSTVDEVAVVVPPATVCVVR